MAFRRSSTRRDCILHVVLLDIRMPNLDGLQAARRILDSASNRARVIMLTTFDLDEYVYDALKAGATGFLRKGRAACAAARFRALGE